LAAKLHLAEMGGKRNGAKRREPQGETTDWHHKRLTQKQMLSLGGAIMAGATEGDRIPKKKKFI